MWVRGSAAPPHLPEGRRRAPSVYTARGGGVRDPRSRWRWRRRGQRKRPRTLEPWPPEAGPGGRATSCGNGFPGARSEDGRSGTAHSPGAPRPQLPGPPAPLPGERAGGGVGQCQLCCQSPRAVASRRRSPLPLPEETRAAGGRAAPGAGPPLSLKCA